MVAEQKSVEKPKRQRTQKQIDAFEKARAKRAENLANKKKDKKPELTKEEKQEIKDYNKGFNVKTDKAPKVEEDTATNVVVSKADYDPFKESNKKTGFGQPKKKELEVEYIDPPPKPKPRAKPQPKPLPPVEEEDSDDMSLWVDSEEDEIEPVVMEKPVKKSAPKAKPKPKPKPKKKPKIVYETESSEEEEIIVKKKRPATKKNTTPVDSYSNLSLKDRLRLNGF